MATELFKPKRPDDAFEVLKLYAIASRVVCASPDSVVSVTKTLVNLGEELVPPESLAAKDGFHLWKVFVRVARLPKPRLRKEASLALHRDLDRLGQQLHLPPLPAWPELPETLLGGKYEDSDEVDTQPLGISIEEGIEQAQAAYRNLGAGESLGAPFVLALLLSLLPSEFERLLKESALSEHLGRGEVGLLARAVANQHVLTEDDEVLLEVLERVGVWMSYHRV